MFEGKGTLCTVKVIDIGMDRGLSLSIGEHKGLSSCFTVVVISRFISCHTCHVTHVKKKCYKYFVSRC